MVGRWLLIGVLLLYFLLIAGCGVTKEDYNTVVAERDSAQARVVSLESELTLVKAELQGIRDAAEVAKLRESVEFLDELNAVLVKDWPRVEEHIAAWKDMRQLAKETDSALIPHMDNVIDQLESLEYLMSVEPPETATLEEGMIWAIAAISEAAIFIDYYYEFEVAVHSSVKQSIKTLNDALTSIDNKP